MKYYQASEFDLSRGEETGHIMLFLSEDIDAAAKATAYTLNLSSAGWRVSPSRGPKLRTVVRKTGDLAWSVRLEHGGGR